jgi:thiamine kinase
VDEIAARGGNGVSPCGPEAVLAAIPGWQGATYRELSGGLSNRTLLVEAGDRSAVLKIDERPRQPPFNTRRAEALVQTTAADHGLANRVLYVADTVFMTEYLEGEVWSGEELEGGANLVALARALRRLHALPLTGRVFDAIGAARNYARRAGSTDADRVRECLQRIESMPLPHNLCCCHNDLVAANIIAAPDIRFLDWEYACDNDPFFDLATVAAHHRLPQDRIDRLLDAYFDGDGARWREQLARMAGFYDALLWLWQASRDQ